MTENDHTQSGNEASGEATHDRPAGVSRREFLAGVGVCGATLVGSGICLARFLLPTVSLERPARVKLGYPEEFPKDSVTYDDRHGVFIVREEDRFYAMDARCTHLQCLVRWQEDAGAFFCPCHGSKFERQGQNIAGPAPKPLERLQISIAEDGRLLVDKDRVFAPADWKDSVLEV